MIALDANVLLRLVVPDDSRQEAIAGRFLARAARDGTALYIGDAVLCELVWVLRSRYGFKRTQIADTVEGILQSEHVVVDEPTAVESVVRDYRAGLGGFADYLIRARAIGAGASEVVTFDKALRGQRGFRLLGA